MTVKAKGKQQGPSKPRKVTGSLATGYKFDCGCETKNVGGTDHKFVAKCDQHVEAFFKRTRPAWVPTRHPEPSKNQTKPDDPRTLRKVRNGVRLYSEAARKARAGIGVKGTGKTKPTAELTQAERDYMHDFAFSSETIRKEVA